MKLLLDTHVLLWWLSDHPALKKAARDLIMNEANIIIVSAASAWEISIKKALGELKSPKFLSETIESSQFIALNITLDHATLAGALPKHHDDPFDRMLIAQAIHENLYLLSYDNHFEIYDVKLIGA